MLEGVQVDFPGVQGFVRQVVGVELDQLNVDIRAFIVQYLLDGLPLVVVRAADADGDPGLAGGIGFVGG